jgi:hypothetical protein
MRERSGFYDFRRHPSPLSNSALLLSDIDQGHKEPILKCGDVAQTLPTGTRLKEKSGAWFMCLVRLVRI